MSAEEVGSSSAGWSSETPLWYYIHREADVRHAGDRLGPVASRIVGEVLIALLDLDPASVRHLPQSWTPEHDASGYPADISSHDLAELQRKYVQRPQRRSATGT